MGVIGDPISHTLSPAMHNAACHELGLNTVYLPFHVLPKDLGHAIAGIRALDIAGINVTIPHKEGVIKYLDEISEESRIIGAVNTIVNKNGRLSGTTTDPEGIRRTLKSKKIYPTRQTITILGTGGTARTALFTFLLDGCKDVAIACRNLKKGTLLSKEALRRFKKNVPVFLLQGSDLKARFDETTLLVNCTSVGMFPATGKTPVDKSSLHAGMTVFDIVYNPIKTRLLKEAGEKGCTVVSGMDMLIYQGLTAFRLITEKTADEETFRKGFLNG